MPDPKRVERFLKERYVLLAGESPMSIGGDPITATRARVRIEKLFFG